MKKIIGLVMAMILCVGVITGCGSAKKATTGGLGKLEIEDGTAPNIGGGENTTSGKPETPSAEVPTEAPTEAPTEVQKVETRYYSDENFSAIIPADWDVYSYKFDSGTGKYRLVVSIYDPNDKNNCIMFASALEPFFTSESDRNYLSRFASEYANAPVIDEISATAVVKSWDGIIKTMRAQGFMYNRYIGNYYVQEIVNSQLISQEGNFTTSIVQANAYAEGSDNVYSLVFQNSFAPFYYAHLDMTWYISYSNYGCAINADMYDEYMPILQECLASLDFSSFDSNNKANADDSDSAVMSPSYIEDFIE